uniref:Uncharacterized protein n=1 Tax=Meloidogyne enterolobii TaxID=390850 RepID=A0A6V7X6F2_MELEN|nr:unnamed protein product [Meloidogyne enterolobii]
MTLKLSGLEMAGTSGCIRLESSSKEIHESFMIMSEFLTVGDGWLSVLICRLRKNLVFKVGKCLFMGHLFLFLRKLFKKY